MKNNEKGEIYYFKNGLFIQMPQNKIRREPSSCLISSHENNKNKAIAENLLNEYRAKKHAETKIIEKIANNFTNNDDIIARSERFLNSKQVYFFLASILLLSEKKKEKITQLTIEKLEENGKYSFKPTVIKKTIN